jgi:cytochrome c biogenesis protein CcdA
MNALIQNIEVYIHQNPWMALLAAFAGGLLTASNPCVLAMIPLTLAYIGGTKEATGVKRALVFSLMFMLGLAITFTALGVIAASLGRLFGDVGNFWKYVVAGVCAIMGLHLLGALKFNLSPVNIRRPKAGGFIGALLLGLLFGIVSTPCAAPVLVVLLAFVASSGNVPFGILLLFVYALGHCVLVLAAGTSMGVAKGILESRGLQKGLDVLRKVSGVLILLVGAYFLVYG